MRHLALILLAPMLLSAASLDQQRADLRALQQLDVRVATLAHRLAVANAARCPDKVAVSGLLLHALGQYAPDQREAAKAEFQALNRVTALAIVPGSAAAKAGLQEGDELSWINRVAVAIPPLSPQASYDNVGKAEEDMRAALDKGPVDLMFVRTGFERSAIVEPELLCPAATQVVPGRKLSASADGRRVSVTTALALATQDDAELAFILAHEMAHNILKHDWVNAPKTDRNRLARAAEEAADRMGVEMMASAGFDPMAAPRFVAREGRKFDNPGLSKRTHMAWADRVRFLTQIAAPLPSRKPAQ